MTSQGKPVARHPYVSALLDAAVKCTAHVNASDTVSVSNTAHDTAAEQQLALQTIILFRWFHFHRLTFQNVCADLTTLQDLSILECPSVNSEGMT